MGAKEIKETINLSYKYKDMKIGINGLGDR
jgi:hypothetical protein